MLDPFRFGQPFLFALDPETAHGLSIAGLRSGIVRTPLTRDPKLAVRVAGLEFPNPIGVAAGFDKNAEVPDALLALDFGFAEIGTVTPLPQAGNAKPRIFRLVRDRAVINRLGFNNEGHAAAAVRLRRRVGRRGIVGVNIGANRDSGDRVGDYVAGVKAFAPLAGYLAVNVSSPNTPGLRSLQDRDSLAELLARVLEARAETTAPAVPVFLKIAPDLTETAMDEIAEVVSASGIDGVIVSNTTLARHGLDDPQHASQAGGLSGRPLFRRSTAVLARMRSRLGPVMPIVGLGGVDSPETALEKIRAGADLVQLYTGMIYEGPGLAARIVRGMSRFAAAEGLASIGDIRDSALDHWLATPLD